MDGLVIILVIFNIIALLGVALFVYSNSTSIAELENEMENVEKQANDSANLSTNVGTLKTEMSSVKTRIGTLTSTTNLTNDVSGLDSRIDILEAGVDRASSPVVGVAQSGSNSTIKLSALDTGSSSLYNGKQITVRPVGGSIATYTISSYDATNVTVTLTTDSRITNFAGASYSIAI